MATIAEKTGVSVDWLLGFPVPAERAARTLAGDFAHQLLDQLRAGAPQFADLELLGQQSDLTARPGWTAVVVEGVINAWWDQQRLALSRQYGAALQSLAPRLKEASATVGDPRIATFMRQQAEGLHRRANGLFSNDVSWRELFELSPGPLISDIPGVTGLALRTRDETTVAYLSAPYPALGGPRGVGVAWRGGDDEGPASGDQAIFIDAVAMEAVHVGGGSFLRELTLVDRFPETVLSLSGQGDLARIGSRRPTADTDTSEIARRHHQFRWRCQDRR